MQLTLLRNKKDNTLLLNQAVYDINEKVERLTTSVDTLTTEASELQSLKETTDRQELDHSVELLWEAVGGILHRIDEAKLTDQQLEIKRLQESSATTQAELAAVKQSVAAMEARWHSTQAELAAVKQSAADAVREAVAAVVRESAAAEGRL
jgi:hypothetical protein